MRKVRIRTIPGFCCANLGSELCAINANNPRIAHANLGSEDLLRKPRIRGFYCANLGFAGNHLGSRNQTSAIRGNKPTIDRARKAAPPSAATWVHCRGWSSCFACAIDRSFFAADGRTALRARSIVASLTRMPSCFACAIDRGFLPRMAEVWLRDPRRLRADPRFAQQIRGSKVCAANPRIRGLRARS